MARFTGGFSHVVTAITAPVASGESRLPGRAFNGFWAAWPPWCCPKTQQWRIGMLPTGREQDAERLTKIKGTKHRGLPEKHVSDLRLLAEDPAIKALCQALYNPQKLRNFVYVFSFLIEFGYLWTTPFSFGGPNTSDGPPFIDGKKIGYPDI